MKQIHWPTYGNCGNERKAAKNTASTPKGLALSKMDDVKNEQYSEATLPDDGRIFNESGVENRDDCENMEDIDDSIVTGSVEVRKGSKVTARSLITLAILVFINLLNYMDRYSLAGMS